MNSAIPFPKAEDPVQVNTTATRGSPSNTARRSSSRVADVTLWMTPRTVRSTGTVPHDRQDRADGC
ncbi:hypothetical protein OHS33_15290 [Streptomyces sp. NBC_00536]|uniref:hypothetical protein n=1 Tax=Streptomyces sp. NBC_00536 TaxID=2975769 RepID=UPI002E81AD0C|nr:hypothetical protein [Streptomyces sp. NBC_00536]WUC79568.1 hypothetical protein OHS33_15290 [Streptomyces sp. NBC_00536]